MKPLSERDENSAFSSASFLKFTSSVGMKPLSERDENKAAGILSNPVKSIR